MISATYVYNVLMHGCMPFLCTNHVLQICVTTRTHWVLELIELFSNTRANQYSMVIFQTGGQNTSILIRHVVTCCNLIFNRSLHNAYL